LKPKTTATNTLEERYRPMSVDLPVVGPVAETERAFALGHTLAEWAMLDGTNLIARTEPFHSWANARRRHDLLPFWRVVEDEPGPRARSRMDGGRVVEGLNFASQDYLGLSTDDRVREAGFRAIRDHGVHSAGSGALQGGTLPSLDLEREVGDFVQAEHVVLFPTGWGVGFGTITALVRPGDHIVMDRLAHACLQQGAHAATKNVHRHDHLDTEAAAEMIAAIRASHPRAGILVITEGLFSMDADSPRLQALKGACSEHEATLLVDVAHDLGQLGPGGTGQIGIQGLLGEVDLVMGTFSKVFCSCGGFLASASAAVRDYVRTFAGTFTFSNALSPVQAAVSLESMRIARSAEGDRLRAELQCAALTLRDAFAAREIFCFGEPCAILAVPIGDETVARAATQFVADAGVLVNVVEFPAVPLGESRFRMQLMPGHTDAMLEQAADVVAGAINRAHELVHAEPVDRNK
jgi:glycine C-acetyltransferase